MAWVGLIRTRQKQLFVRVEDAEAPCWTVRVYDGETVVGEGSAEGPQQAVSSAVQLARQYLDDESISVGNVDWIQR